MYKYWNKRVILYIYKHTSVPDRLRPKCWTPHGGRPLLSVPQFAKCKRNSCDVILEAFPLAQRVFQTYKTKQTLGLRNTTSPNLTFLQQLLVSFFFFFLKRDILYTNRCIRVHMFSSSFRTVFWDSPPERASIGSLGDSARKPTAERRKPVQRSGRRRSPLERVDWRRRRWASQSMPKPSLPSLMASFNNLCSSL